MKISDRARRQDKDADRPLYTPVAIYDALARHDYFLHCGITDNASLLCAAPLGKMRGDGPLPPPARSTAPTLLLAGGCDDTASRR